MAVPAWVAEYVGIPYAEKGRDHSGCDCWGLLNLVWEERLGGPLPPYHGVRWQKHGNAARIGPQAAAYASQFEPVVPGNEQLGDGILIRMRGHPLHVGLVVDKGWMLHAHEAADACLEQYGNDEWSRRILGFYRYKG